MLTTHGPDTLRGALRRVVRGRRAEQGGGVGFAPADNAARLVQGIGARDLGDVQRFTAQRPPALVPGHEAQAGFASYMGQKRQKNKCSRCSSQCFFAGFFRFMPASVGAHCSTSTDSKLRPVIVETAPHPNFVRIPFRPAQSKGCSFLRKSDSLRFLLHPSNFSAAKVLRWRGFSCANAEDQKDTSGFSTGGARAH